MNTHDRMEMIHANVSVGNKSTLLEAWEKDADAAHNVGKIYGAMAGTLIGVALSALVVAL